MSDRINLADPDFEPTDEQLIELSRQAFAGIKEARAESRVRMRAEIAKLREAAKQEFAARRSGG